MPATKVSVIIPALNEATLVAEAARSAGSQGADQVVVVDGGSQDATAAAAAETGALVLRATPAQRARQMNHGAHAASGDLFIFLHADSRLLPGSLDALRREARTSPLVGGGFRRRYQTRSPLLSLSGFIGNQRATRLGWFFGDQAIWVRRDVFHRLGGFPEIPDFEDLDFTRKLKRLGPTRLISPGVETSARRFKNGTIARISNDLLLTVRHVCLDPAP